MLMMATFFLKNVPSEAMLADFSNPSEAMLTFAPPECDFNYPVILPGALGTISCESIGSGSGSGS
jgi:hypothetical protein